MNRDVARRASFRPRAYLRISSYYWPQFQHDGAESLHTSFHVQAVRNFCEFMTSRAFKIEARLCRIRRTISASLGRWGSLVLEAMSTLESFVSSILLWQRFLQWQPLVSRREGSELDSYALLRLCFELRLMQFLKPSVTPMGRLKRANDARDAAIAGQLYVTLKLPSRPVSGGKSFRDQRHGNRFSATLEYD